MPQAFQVARTAAASALRRRRLTGLVIAVAVLLAVTSQLTLRDLDVAVYHQAAERVFIEGVDPYQRRPGDQLPFTYPPTALILFAPLVPLNVDQSVDLMLALNLVLAVAVMAIVTGDLARDDPSGRLLLWGPLYIAGSGGLYLTLVFGQINLLLLLLLWVFWRGVRRGRAAAASGTALALGCIAKPHYALLAIAAGPRPGVRLVLGAGAAGLALFTLSLSVAPHGAWDSWLSEIVATSSVTSLPPGHSSIAAPWNRSIPGLVARFLMPNKFTEPVIGSPAAARLIATTLILALGAATAWLLGRSMRRQDRTAIDHDLELSLIAVAVFLAAPASWTHHLVMLLPAALVLLRDAVLAPGEPAGGRLAAALVLAVLALTLDDLMPRELRVSSQAVMSLITIAVIALWLLLAQRLDRRIRVQRAA